MRIRVSASTRYVGSLDSMTVEVDDEDLEDMGDAEREGYLEDVARDHLFDHLITWDWEVA